MQCTVLTANSEDVTIVAGVQSKQVRFDRNAVRIATSFSIVISAKKEHTGREGKREGERECEEGERECEEGEREGGRECEEGEREGGREGGRKGGRKGDVGISERVIKYSSRRAERDAGRR